MMVAPQEDSCKHVHDWEHLLVKGSAHQHPRLYERPVGTLHAQGELRNWSAMLIPPVCPGAALRSICPGCWSMALGVQHHAGSCAAFPSLGWGGTLRGRGSALRGGMPASQNQAVGRCELLGLRSSKVLCIQKMSASLCGPGHEASCQEWEAGLGYSCCTISFLALGYLGETETFFLFKNCSP